MNKELAKQTKATITSLFKQLDLDVVPLEQLNVILSTPPPATWVKQHPFIKGYNYLPIDKVEYLLRRCFKKYQIEVIKTAQLFNAIEVTVRVHYLNPATNEMMYHDGVGAQELQTTKGSGNLNMDMSNVNKGAVMMALPIAKSIAIKDACDHFGDLFGANLNRKDIVQFTGDTELLSAEGIHNSKEKERVEKHILNANNVETLMQVENLIEKYELTEIYNNKKQTLQNGK
ncbi:MAG: hypothetical protein RLZZ425_741 [Bacteroidota bacterium]|jgi:hypothetical protein